MTLAKALKRKNRLTQKISKLQQEIQSENSVRADDLRKIKVEDLMSEFNEKVDQLIKLKIAIFIASTPQRENILRLGELKSQIIFFQGITNSFFLFLTFPKVRDIISSSLLSCIFFFCLFLGLLKLIKSLAVEYNFSPE